MAMFCGAVLIAAVISIAALSSPAYAASNAYRYPPYSPGYSSPNNTCIGGSAGFAQYCAAHSNTDGVGRVYVKSALNGWVIAKVEHNLNPPQSNPSITVTTPNYVNIIYTNAAKGKFYLDDDSGSADARLRVGGWTTVLRQADQTWIKDKNFYKEYNGYDLATGEYTIPYTNFKTDLNKNNNPGKYGVGTFIQAMVYGDEESARGTIDAWTTTKSYKVDSEVLSVECALCP